MVIFFMAELIGLKLGVVVAENLKIMLLSFYGKV